jgi:hypothetical protein
MIFIIARAFYWRHSVRIYLVNGSPKAKVSISESLLTKLNDKINESAQITTIKHYELTPQIINESDSIVLAFPLYVDAVPSSLMSTMEIIHESVASDSSNTKVYIIVNNGFYEAKRNELAVQVVKHWCIYSKLDLAGALCVGAGPLYNHMANQTSNLDRGLDKLASAINNQLSLNETLFIDPSIKKEDYMSYSNTGWIKAAKQRGLSETDLHKQL